MFVEVMIGSYGFGEFKFGVLSLVRNISHIKEIYTFWGSGNKFIRGGDCGDDFICLV